MLCQLGWLEQTIFPTFPFPCPEPTRRSNTCKSYYFTFHMCILAELSNVPLGKILFCEFFRIHLLPVICVGFGPVGANISVPSSFVRPPVVGSQELWSDEAHYRQQ
eukprot:gb/GECG01006741.1/.p1 GENE.gb/GECG01006741.1/~~gb/GECG01006741.1/.p1  ORF type:complete len:106 (+),score=3.23 gb/GECG01006741.1/:1-318(+)